MRKNTLKKAMAVMISATMLVTGYTVVSAEGFTDAEALAEMDAFTTGDEAVYVEEVQPEQIQLTHVGRAIGAHTGHTVLSFFFRQKNER